jgi:hypothetical protein
MASLAALAAVVSVLAAPPGTGASPADPDAPQPEVEEADVSEAKRAFDEGLTAVADGEYELAVERFERAQALGPHPVTLFNLALALELAGRSPEAWELFDALVAVAESDRERRQIRRRMAKLDPQIAVVEIEADRGSRLCLDDFELVADDEGHRHLAVEPGRHTIRLDGLDIDVDLRPGDHRVLLLEDRAAKVGGRRGLLMPAMLGTGVGAAALALGLGVGALSTADTDLRTGLTVGASVSAGVALTAGIVAILVETRKLRDPSQSRHAPCPGNPELEGRVDVRIGPTLERPANFAAAIGPGDPGRLDELYERGVALPSSRLAAIPPSWTSTRAPTWRLDGIAPPRSSEISSRAQKRPETTAPAPSPDHASESRSERFESPP